MHWAHNQGCWKTRNAQEWNGTEPEVIDTQYRRGRWTLILRSVTATKTGQAPTESHVKHIKLPR